MKKTFVYYIVYEAWKSGRSRGKGSCEAMHPKKINSIEDLNTIEVAIKEDKTYLSDYEIQIINYKFLRVE